MRNSRFTLLLLLSAVPVLHARPAHKKALADFLGPFLTPKLNDCRTCHLPDPPDKKSDLTDDKPHNSFGERLKQVRKERRKAGLPYSIADAVQTIAEEDSDGDGVPNLLELLAGHNPGEAKDVPPPARVAEMRKVLIEFRRSQSSYPWKPFEVVRKPGLPQIAESKTPVRNAIDVFLSEKRQTAGIATRPDAPREVLLRRVYLDLIGLPPTREELHVFLADNSVNAYEKVVDRLLNDPRHGERWGRHWMDVWRYSDWAGWTGGGQIRDSQPHIWRWRDWIIESLNEDKGYDRMIVEMLAADEVAPEDEKALRATGYLVRNYKMLSREKWMQDTVEHTAQAFLGVTLACARCHDHQYDPLTQKEYYQVRAIFEPHQVRIDLIPGELDVKKDGLVRAYDANAAVPTYFFVRGDDRYPDKTKPIPPGVPEALGGKPFKVEPVKLPLPAVAPDKRPFVLAELIRGGEESIRQAKAALETARKTGNVTLTEAELALAEARHRALTLVLKAEQLEDAGRKGSDEWKKIAEQAMAAQRQQAVCEARKALVLAKQAKAPMPKKVTDAEQALAKAEAAVKIPATTAYTPRTVARYPEMSSGRRLAFARWLADRDNPLTARVAVNHIWMRHFGQPLVPRVFDFGRNGRPPSHPALLDWLAAEFMEGGWSMKRLHRLIVTSSAYRMDSTPDDAALKLDPDNVHYWRMAPRRLEAEVVRDCVLYTAGSLDLARGGPDIDYTLGMTVPRRSLYFRHAAEKQMEFLKLFDAASVTECYQRKESILPQQALALANSDLTRRHGRLLARKLAAQTGNDPLKFTTAAFETVLARSPTDAEKSECVAFLAEQTQRFTASKTKPATNTDGVAPAADPAVRACEGLVHVLLNHHDFVTVR